MTDYLRVRNWEKHQHRDLAGKGNMPWLKLDAGIFDDPAIADLTAPQFRAYIRALTLAARTGNKLPASKAWLRAHFGTNWERNALQLSKHGLLEGTIPTTKPPQTATTRRANTAPVPRLEEKRGEEKDRSVTTNPVEEDEIGSVLTLDGGEGGLERGGAGASGNVFKPGGVMDAVEAQAARGSGRVVDLASRRDPVVARGLAGELIDRSVSDFGAFVESEEA